MNRIKTYAILSILSIPYYAHATFDPGSFLGGVVSIASVWAGYGVYAKHTDETAQKERQAMYKTTYQKNIDRLQQKIDDKTSDQLLDTADPDKQIQKMASFLVRESTNSNCLINDIKTELAQLKNCISDVKQHDSARSDDSEVDDAMRHHLHDLVQQVQQKEQKLQSLYDLVKKEQPFIDLNYAAYTEPKRLSSYKQTLQHQVRFPRIDVIDNMNGDVKWLMKHVEQAQTSCRDQGCNTYKEQLITLGKQQLTAIEKQQATIEKSKEFLEEKKSYDVFHLEKEKTAQAHARERVEQQRNNIVMREQNIKKEQLRQHEEQLRQNNEQLRQNKVKELHGLLFEPERQRYKGKIRALKKEKHGLEHKLEHIHEDASDLEDMLQASPFNPDFDQDFAIFLNAARTAAHKIYQRSSRKS